MSQKPKDPPKAAATTSAKIIKPRAASEDAKKEKGVATARPFAVKKAMARKRIISASARRKMAAYQQKRVAEHLAKSVAMLQQVQAGTSVKTIARRHGLSTKTVYQKLAKARDMHPIVANRGGTVVVEPAAEADERRKAAYLEGRIDQLETVLTQFIKLGVDKILRVIAP